MRRIFYISAFVLCIALTVWFDGELTPEQLKEQLNTNADPFRLAEVPQKVVEKPRTRTVRPDEDTRKDRIAKQWAEFLQP